MISFELHSKSLIVQAVIRVVSPTVFLTYTMVFRVKSKSWAQFIAGILVSEICLWFVPDSPTWDCNYFPWLIDSISISAGTVHSWFRGITFIRYLQLRFSVFTTSNSRSPCSLKWQFYRKHEISCLCYILFLTGVTKELIGQQYKKSAGRYYFFLTFPLAYYFHQ
jgi:hypothetical protein